MLLLGAHLSIAGGVHRAVELAGTLKCNCLQIFLRNQRQWKSKPLSDEQVRRWFEALDGARPKIVHVAAHSSYLINLASDRVALRRRSVKALREELDRCRTLNIDRLVLHPGSHRGAGLTKGIAWIVEALTEVLRQGGQTKILLETTSGAGDSIGRRLEEIAEIIAGCEDHARLGCCLDTCHLFAAGYPLSPKGQFHELIRQIGGRIGFDRVGCLHLNDSVGELGGRHDRHEHIGRGKIGPRAFRYFLHEPKLADVPKIIETPKGGENTLAWDRRKLRVLRGLARRQH